jgi:hypothetical protein
MSDSKFSKAVPVSVTPTVSVVHLPVFPGVELATGTYWLPFAEIQHLCSHKPLRPRYRPPPQSGGTR